MNFCTYNFRSFITITILLLVTNVYKIYGQEKIRNEQFVVEGELLDGDAPVSGAIMNVYADNFRVTSANTNQYGAFKFKLVHNTVYTIEILKKGYIAQKVTLDCNVSNDVLKKGGIGETVDFTINIFQDYTGLKNDIFLQPVVYYVFNSEKGWYFEPDNKRSKLTQLFQINAKVNTLKLKDQQRLVSEALKAIQKKDNETALLKYIQANNLIPFDENVAEKLNELIKTYKKNDLLVDFYKSYIDKGNMYFNKKNYDSAYIMFSAAKKIYTKEKFIDNKLNSIDSAQSILYIENKAIFDTLRVKADNEFNKKNYTQAINIYTQALNVFTNDVYVKDKVAAINKIFISEKKQKEQETKAILDKFNQQLTIAADYAAKTNYLKAIEECDKALTILPNDSGALSLKTAYNQKYLNQQALKIEKYFTDTLVLAENEYKLKNYAQSLYFYKALNRLKPNNEKPLLKIKELEKLLGKKQGNK